MIEQRQGLIECIRKKFMHVETCPFEGERIFFENAGGSLRLNQLLKHLLFMRRIPITREEKTMLQNLSLSQSKMEKLK